MAIEQRRPRQGEMPVRWDELSKSPGHAFHDRLQAVLIAAGFDASTMAAKAASAPGAAWVAQVAASTSH